MSIDPKTDVVWRVASEFSGVPLDQLPQSRASICESLIAESVRIALQEASPAPPEWPIAHIVTVRAWVTRKLRGVLPGVRDKESDEVGKVLRSGLGQNLEFLGDVLFLASGNCMPAPPRAVPLGDARFLLVSGLPSRRFVEAGLKLQFHGVVRWIIGATNEDLQRVGIPIQSRETYAGLDRDLTDPRTFLQNCLAENAKTKVGSLAGGEYYFGNVHDSYGFEFGTISRRVETSDGSLGIVRTPREWEQSNYWLRFDSSEGVTEVVSIPRPDWKKAALAFDALAGYPRLAVLSQEGSETILSLNFSPPESVMRWILALGGRWLGSVMNRIRWRIPTASAENLRDVLSGLWLKIEARSEVSWRP